MADLNIRKVDDELLKELKIRAVVVGMTLRQYVIHKLTDEPPKENAGMSEPSEISKARSRKEAVLVEGTVQSTGEGEKGKKGECAHGKGKKGKPRRAEPKNFERAGDEVGAVGLEPSDFEEVKQTQPRQLNPEHPEYVGLLWKNRVQKMKEAPATDVKVRAEKDRRKCPHGTKEGYPCWQCGGIAKTS